jgi:hypothetical protein
MTTGFKLASRRRILQGMLGAAPITVALPFLNCFLDSNGTAVAATGAPLPTFFGVWFWGCGLNPGRWEPKKVGAHYDTPPELKPLERFKNHLNVYSGFKVFTDGKAQKPHYTGNIGILTGHVPTGQDVQPSIDSLVAEKIGTETRFKSLEMTATGDPKHTQSYRGGSVVNPAEVSPAALYTRLFGPEFRDPNSAEFKPDPRVMARRSVLSSITEQRQDLERDLGSEDRVRLDEYFTSLRQTEHQLELQLQAPTRAEACTVPGKMEETPYSLDIEEGTKNHALFGHLLAHALACNQTRVFSMIFTDANSMVRRPGTTATHHILTHEEAIDEMLGYQPQATWFINRIIEQFGAFLGVLESVKEGAGTLLDRALVMAVSETGFAKTHSLENIAMFTAGNAGGKMRTGLHIQAKGDPATRLGLTLQQIMGVPVSKWGTESLETSKSISEVLV